MWIVVESNLQIHLVLHFIMASWVQKSKLAQKAKKNEPFNIQILLIFLQKNEIN